MSTKQVYNSPYSSYESLSFPRPIQSSPLQQKWRNEGPDLSSIYLRPATSTPYSHTNNFLGSSWSPPTSSPSPYLRSLTTSQHTDVYSSGSQLSLSRTYTDKFLTTVWQPPIPKPNLPLRNFPTSGTDNLFPSITPSIFQKSSTDFLNDNLYRLSSLYSPERPLFSTQDRLFSLSQQELFKTYSSQTDSFLRTTPFKPLAPINHGSQPISLRDRVQVLDDNGNVESYPLLDAQSNASINQALQSSLISSAKNSFVNHVFHLFQGAQIGLAHMGLSEMDMTSSEKTQILESIMIKFSKANAERAMKQLNMASNPFGAGREFVFSGTSQYDSFPLVKLDYGAVEPACIPFDLYKSGLSLLKGAYKVGAFAFAKGSRDVAKGLITKAPKSAKSNFQLSQQIQKAPAGGAYNRVTFEKYQVTLRAQMEKPHVVDPELQRFVNKVYKPHASIGSGSTAAAIRHELATGERVFDRFHSKKGRDMIVTFKNWLKNNPTARAGDRAAAENIIKDLQNALGE